MAVHQNHFILRFSDVNEIQSREFCPLRYVRFTGDDGCLWQGEVASLWLVEKRFIPDGRWLCFQRKKSIIFHVLSPVFRWTEGLRKHDVNSTALRPGTSYRIVARYPAVYTTLRSRNRSNIKLRFTTTWHTACCKVSASLTDPLMLFFLKKTPRIRSG